MLETPAIPLAGVAARQVTALSAHEQVIAIGVAGAGTHKGIVAIEIHRASGPAQAKFLTAQVVRQSDNQATLDRAAAQQLAHLSVAGSCVHAYPTVITTLSQRVDGSLASEVQQVRLIRAAAGNGLGGYLHSLNRGCLLSQCETKTQSEQQQE